MVRLTSAPAGSERGPQRLADLRGALAVLLGRGAVPTDVREEIGASWQRSVFAGLKPDQIQVPFDPDVASDGLLARAAGPVLDQLALDLAGAPVGVVLATERGHLVNSRVADTSLRARFDRIRLAPGFIYAEDVVGTNAFGTALAQRRPATVEGAEHFADALISVAAAGAPVLDPRGGHILGVVGLTSLASHSSALMLALATRAARDVEQRLLDDAGVSERLLLQRFLQERRGAKGPLVLLTRRMMITNAAADRLISTDDEVLLRQCATRLLNGACEDTPPVVTPPVVLSGGAVVAVAGEPLLDGGSQVGAVLRLKRIAPVTSDRPRARAGHPTFGWEGLTGTEHSVISLVAEGLTNREAAERLYLSHHTVGFHLRSIFCKLGVNSRVELTRRALEHQRGSDPGAPVLVAFSESG